MARGWESKSVESQMEEARERVPYREPGPSAEQKAQRSAREGLELSRERILRELGETSHERRREQLQAGLAFLDQKLSDLKPIN